MELKDIVCSLEHAKRLKELGVKQESLISWMILDKNHPRADDYKYLHDEKGYNNLINGTLTSVVVESGEFSYYSAFIAPELLEILPDEVEGNRWQMSKGMELFGKPYVFGYPKIICFNGANQQEAMVKMLIHLIENGLIEVNA